MNAPNNPDNQFNPSPPNTPSQQNSAQGTKKKGGFPCGWIAAGCGCLTLLLLLIGGVSAYFLYSRISDDADSDNGGIFSVLTDEGGIVDMLSEGNKEAKKNKKMSKSEKKAAKKAEKKAKDEMKNAISSEKIRAYMKKPLTQKEVDAHLKFFSDWEKNPTQKAYVKQVKRVEELGEMDEGESESMANQLKIMNEGVKVANLMTKVTEAFDEHIRQNGGYETYYSRVVRIGGLVAASETIKSNHKKLKDADSDAVSKQMLKERPEVAKQYEENFKEAKKALKENKKSGGKNSGSGLGALAIMGQGPGTVAMARMPKKSFQTWDKLSKKKRKQVRESLNPKDGFAGWFGLFSVNPATLLVSATMAEVEALGEE